MNRPLNNMKQIIIYFSLTGFFFSFTFFIYAPLEMYLNNIDEFEFNLRMFWWMPVITGLFITILTIGLGLLVNLVFKRIGTILYGAFLFALGLACYVQGNFAGLKVGVLNGALIPWTEYTDKVVVNLFIWIGIIFAVLVFLYFLKYRAIKVLHFTAAILIAVQLVALNVTVVSVDQEKESLKAKMVISDKGMFELSAQRNVIIFVLDMLDDTYFKTMLETDDSFKAEFSQEKFPGFTYFANSVGSASTTQYSMGTIMTGHYLLNEGSTFTETQDKAYDKTDFYDILLDNHYRLDLYISHGFSQRIMDKMSNYMESKAYVHDTEILTKKIYQLVLCKYAPDILKPFVWMNGTEFEGTVKRDISAFSHDNIKFFTALKNSQFTSNNETNIFKLIHIDGAHYPYTMDENVNPVPENWTGAIAAARGSFQIAFEYLQNIKDLGVYDQSTIIICADHGYAGYGTLTNPVLLVKRAGDSGDLQINDAPVHHLDFHATIMTDLNLNPDHKYGKSVFEIEKDEQRNRMFYQYDLRDPTYNSMFRLIEYSVADESNLRKSFRLTDREITNKGEIIPHRINCEYCLSGAYDDEDPNALGSDFFVHKQK